MEKWRICKPLSHFLHGPPVFEAYDQEVKNRHATCYPFHKKTLPAISAILQPYSQPRVDNENTNLMINSSSIYLKLKILFG